MNKSESIAKLAIALSKLQGEVTDAAKDKAAYNYSYADLAGVLEIARPLCLKYELAVTQLCTNANEIDIGITTILMHSSGEWVESTFTMPISSAKASNAAQAAGSIITYCRRYALAAILGITQVDNDAQDTAPVKAPHTSSKITEPDTANATSSVVTIDYQALLKKYCTDNKITTAQANAWCAMYGVDKLTQLNFMQIEAIIGNKFNGR